MRITRTLAAVAVGAVALTLVAGCTSPGIPDEETQITFGRLNPAAAEYNFDPTAPQLQGWQGWAVYDFLIGWAESAGRLEFEPFLATEWEFNADNTSITLRLRDDVTFTDGTPFNAQALAANIDYGNEIEAGVWPSIGATGYEILGDYEIAIDLTAELNQTTVLQNLASAVVGSPEALTVDPEALASSPVGTGPYVLDEENSTAGVEYAFVRNEDYWNPDAYPYDTVVVKEYADAVAAANALKTGQVDFAGIDASTAADVEGSGFEIYPSHGFWVGLFLDDRDGSMVPALGDIRVRQAMNHAFDRETIAATVGQGYAQPGYQVFVETQFEYQDGREDEFSYDPELARELLAEAGYPGGFELNLPTTGTSPYDPVIVQSLGDIGITVTLEQIEAADLFSRWQGGVDPVLAVQQRFVNAVAFFMTPAGVYTRDVPEEVVEILEARNSGDAGEQEEAAAQLGELVMDEAWFVIVSQPDVLFAGIEGLEVEPNNVSGLAPLLPNIRPAS